MKQLDRVPSSMVCAAANNPEADYKINMTNKALGSFKNMFQLPQ